MCIRDSSDNVDADNYYVKFYADNGTQGSGKWEECVRPNNFSSGSDPMVKGLDPATMPHALVNNRNGTFSFKKLDETTANAAGNDNYWKYREVGDDITNPFPSFKGLEIQNIFFHRNRLGLIANEQVVMSRPGDYFNFQNVSFKCRHTHTVSFHASTHHPWVRPCAKHASQVATSLCTLQDKMREASVQSVSYTHLTLPTKA